MTLSSHHDLLIVRRLILGFLRFVKWGFSFVWLVLLAGIAASTISTWLTSKKLDLPGTPLGWVINNLLLVVSFGFCLILLTIVVWILSFFLERDTSWLYSVQEKERTKLRRQFATTIEHEI